MAESPDSQIIDPIFDNYAQKSGELSSGNMNHMPVLEFSPPDSPVAKHISGDQTRYPRKESPAFKTSDGPNGARGAIFKAGTKAALFPCGVSLAASWNKDLLFQKYPRSFVTGEEPTVSSNPSSTDVTLQYSVSTLWRGEKTVRAVENGKLGRKAVEAAAANILRLVERTKGGDMSRRSDAAEERRRTIAYQAISRIAVTGLNATRAIAGGGGSAFLNPYYITLPLDSIRAVAEQNVSFAIGCQTYKWLPLAAEYCATAVGDPGVTLEFFLGDEFDGEPKNDPYTPDDWAAHDELLECRCWEIVRRWRSEGLYIGYRHYQHLKLTPLFPFGHGLSYTTFTYGTPTISHAVLSFAPDSRLTVSIPVTNSGSVPGTGMPGKTKDALLSLDEYPVGYWDTDAGECIVEEGIFEVLIGASSADIRERSSFAVKTSFSWIF
ncbi:uncharacterized protein L3040_007533 [Drepanopeziza brunnea f. sp. 'multigermtubi']|uniref:uncharacterized protein n=1 Tax=Drepanopeziza brunnea f. sp. 'multigermtubi' TaxID=698441 RepID=UPI0023A1992A|nr:hypothetical protein L3040_007533 [Drepanopeziza brunnea f. sp. 'multigermtubi']